MSPHSTLITHLHPVGLSHTSGRKLAGRRGQCIFLLNGAFRYPARDQNSPSSYLLAHWNVVFPKITPTAPRSNVQLTGDDIRALPMISDVNLFFEHQRDDPDFEVECEVMIVGASTPLPTFPGTKGDAWHHPLAEPTYRGQRRAQVALALLLSCALDTLCGVRSPSWCGSARERTWNRVVCCCCTRLRHHSDCRGVRQGLDADHQSWGNELVSGESSRMSLIPRNQLVSGSRLAQYSEPSVSNPLPYFFVDRVLLNVTMARR